MNRRAQRLTWQSNTALLLGLITGALAWYMHFILSFVLGLPFAVAGLVALAFAGKWDLDAFCEALYD